LKPFHLLKICEFKHCMVYEGLSHERSDVIARRIALTGDLPAVLSFGVPVAAGPFEDAGAALAGADYATTLRL